MSATEHHIRGPLDIALQHQDGEWWATAVAFDLLGSGPTKRAARKELFELVTGYLEDIVEALRAGNSVRFFNPTPANEYKSAHIEHYTVHLKATCTFAPGARFRLFKQDSPTKVARNMGDLEDLIKEIDSLNDVQFTPVG